MNAASQVQSTADFSKTTFLVVDDKPFYRDMAHTALARGKARSIEHATDVEKGLQLIKRLGQRIGCIVSDWDMAPAGALDLLKMVRTRALTTLPANTPFVILTGQADSAAIKAAMAMDVNGVAIAPLSFDKFNKVISNALARNWTLQAKDHYAAVPLVQSAKAAPQGGASTRSTPRGTLLKQGSGVKSAAGATHGGAALRNGPAGAARKTSVPAEPELRKVHLSNLAHVAPGNVVARDIKDKDGKMLVSTGTELSASLIARLKEHSDGHPDSFHLWVGEWDK